MEHENTMLLQLTVLLDGTISHWASVEGDKKKNILIPLADLFVIPNLIYFFHLHGEQEKLEMNKGTLRHCEFRETGYLKKICHNINGIH